MAVLLLGGPSPMLASRVGAGAGSASSLHPLGSSQGLAQSGSSANVHQKELNWLEQIDSLLAGAGFCPGPCPAHRPRLQGLPPPALRPRWLSAPFPVFLPPSSAGPQGPSVLFCLQAQPEGPGRAGRGSRESGCLAVLSVLRCRSAGSFREQEHGCSFMGPNTLQQVSFSSCASENRRRGGQAWPGNSGSGTITGHGSLGKELSLSEPQLCHPYSGHGNIQLTALLGGLQVSWYGKVSANCKAAGRDGTLWSCEVWVGSGLVWRLGRERGRTQEAGRRRQDAGRRTEASPGRVQGFLVNVCARRGEGRGSSGEGAGEGGRDLCQSCWESQKSR